MLYPAESSHVDVARSWVGSVPLLSSVFAELSGVVSASESTAYVAMLSSRPVGFFVLSRRGSAEVPIYRLSHVVVDPGFRGRSVASTMLSDILAATAPYSVDVVLPSQIVSAVRLFRRLGFEPIPRAPQIPEGFVHLVVARRAVPIPMPPSR